MMASVSQRVPAWKRLGLKLKEPGASSGPDANANANAASTASSRKRKEPPTSSLTSSEASTKQRKSVSFAGDVQTPSDGTPKRKANKKTRKAKKALKKKKLAMDTKEEAVPPNMQRSLEYLSLWQTSRETWRFNKNCQRLILKYVFLGTDGIPSSHMAAFYDYIRDLKGDSRRRLREEAGAICSTDAADAKEQSEEQKKTSKGDKEETEGKDEPGASVAEYVRVLDECVAARGGAFYSDDTSTRIDEAGFLPRLEDASLQKRLARRIRAENIVHELDSSGVDDTDSSKVDTSKLTAAVEEQKKPSDAPPEKKRSVRSSKKRTMVDSDSDSSSDDSDSDSDGSTE